MPNATTSNDADDLDLDNTGTPYAGACPCSLCGHVPLFFTARGPIRPPEDVRLCACPCHDTWRLAWHVVG
jgi:hypothetical protein